MGCFPSFHGQTNIENIAKIAHAPVAKTTMGSPQCAPSVGKISEANSFDSISTGSKSFVDNDSKSHGQSTGSSNDEGVEHVEKIQPSVQRGQCRQRMVRSKHRIQDAVLARKNSFEKRQQAHEKARLIGRAIQLKKAIKKLELRRGEQFIRRARAESVGDELTASGEARLVHEQNEYVNNATEQLKQQLLLLQAETHSMDNHDGIAADGGTAKIVSANLSELFCVEQIIEEYQLGQNRAQSAESYEMLRQRQKSQMRLLKRKTHNFFFHKREGDESEY
jgi:hypothetical protein